MSSRIKDLFPAWCDTRRELLNFMWTLLIVQTAFPLAVFLFIFCNKLNTLYYYRGGTRYMTGEMMPPFETFCDVERYVFVITVLSCVVLAFRYFRAHRANGSRSDYLMRRLPDRWEFVRRCCAMPCVFAAASVVTFVVMISIFYAVYMLGTPAQCLPEGGGGGFWRGLLCWR